MKRCEQCSEPFLPREAKQRFCCRECSTTWFQNERREAVKRHRDAHQTYHAMAVGDSDAEGGPAVTGASPPQLGVPQWSLDAASLPKEPPLGDDVNSLPDCTGIGGRNWEAEDGEAA